MTNDPATVRELWKAHQSECRGGCGRCDPKKTATLAHVCVLGAPLLKDVLELDAQPALAKRRKAAREHLKQMMGEFYGTPAQVKRLMRYVEDR